MLSTANLPTVQRSASTNKELTLDSPKLASPICVLTDGTAGASDAKWLGQTNLVNFTLQQGSAEVATEEGSELAYREYIFFTGDVRTLCANANFFRENLRDGQNIVLLNAPVGASVQLSHSLKQAGLDWTLNIAELGEIFFNEQLAQPVSNVAAMTRNQLRRLISVGNVVPVALIPASNIFERAFLDVERISRPALLLFGLLNSRGGDGDQQLAATIFSPSMLHVLVRLEQEIIAIAKSYRAVAPSFDRGEDLLGDWYPKLARQVKGTTEATKIVVREMSEHVCLIAELGHRAKVPIPTLESIIGLANTIADLDVRANARTLADLGLDGLSRAELIEFVNA